METLQIDRDPELPGLVTITLNRPDKLNAISGAMHRDLQQACRDLQDDARGTSRHPDRRRAGLLRRRRPRPEPDERRRLAAARALCEPLGVAGAAAIERREPDRGRA